MAELFIAQGHTVFGCGRSENLVQALQKHHGAPHDFGVVDVRDDHAVKKWAEGILSAGTIPDLILNNAGVINRSAPLWEMTDHEFSEILDINIRGTANMIRHFAPAMMKRKAGVIVNFSSGWGRSTDANVAPYCATKWAIEGLSQALAQELPRGMAAVALNPGIINTDMLQKCFGNSAAHYPTPDQWAKRAVPFLLALGPKDNGKALTVPGIPT